MRSDSPTEKWRLFEIQTTKNPLYWMERIVRFCYQLKKISLEDWHNDTGFEYGLVKELESNIIRNGLGTLIDPNKVLTFMVVAHLSGFDYELIFDNVTIKVHDGVLKVNSIALSDNLQNDFCEYLKYF